MTNERLVAQSYVMTKEGLEYKLEYYIFSKLLNHGSTYGIAIKQYSSSDVASESELISENESDVLSTIDNFAKHFVFPSSLCDLIHDMC